MKNVKGGYKIISLEENDLTASFSVKGIYNALSKTYDKTILVSGIVIDGEKKNDAYTEVNVDSTYYKFTVYGYEVTVSSDDSVEAEEVVTDAVTSIGGVSGSITLGSGLSITEEGELSASGDKLYQHMIRVSKTGYNVTLLLINSSSDLINTSTKFNNAIPKASTTHSYNVVASGMVYKTSYNVIVNYVYIFSNSQLYFLGLKTTDGVLDAVADTLTSFTFEDNVIEIQ